MVNPHKAYELVSPLSDVRILPALIKAGADAVYFGLPEYNLRQYAKAVLPPELPQLVQTCHANHAHCYLALNAICFDHEVEQAGKILELAAKYKVDAVIAWDPGVISMANELGIPVHISTQASVANQRAAEACSRFANRVVLARELDLDQVRKIARNSLIPVECFVHGAMCVSVSGRCFLSQYLYNKSANRGACIQPCRRKYMVTDPLNQNKVLVQDQAIFSPKDLCCLPFMDLLMQAGIRAFKIEGRMRSAEYAVTVTQCYRQAMDAVNSNRFTKSFVCDQLQKLRQVYQRGFSPGFYLGTPTADDWAKKYGSLASHRKNHCGVVVNFYKKHGVAEIQIQAGRLKIGDVIIMQGRKTGYFSQPIKSMEIDRQPIEQAQKGQNVGVLVNQEARRGDKVFVMSRIAPDPTETYAAEIMRRIQAYQGR